MKDVYVHYLRLRLWRVTQMLLGALSEVRVKSLFFWEKRAHLQGQVPISSGCILEILNTLKVLFHDPLILGFSVKTQQGGRTNHEKDLSLREYQTAT